MTQGNPYVLYLKYMIPLLIGNIMQQLYNVVDTIVVGNVLGDTAMAAVGSGFPFLFLLTSVFIGIGLGAMIVVAQLAGQKDEVNLQRLLGTIYRLVLICAIPLTIIGVLASGPVLRLLQVQEAETLREATLYLQVVFLGVLGTFGFNINAGFLQGLGDSMSSLLFLAIATVLNIVLDLVLTLVFPLGILGVAIATSFSQTFSWVFGIFYINRRYKYLHIHLWRMPFDMHLLKRSLRLGLPGSAQQFLYAIGNMVLQGLVNSNGKIFTAGFVAANKVDTFVFLPILSMATSITTYIGQNAGKHDLPRIKRGTKAGLTLVIVISLTISALIYLFRVPVLSLFNQNPDVIKAGVYYLEAVLPFYFVLGLLYAINAIFQGAGQTVLPMISSSIALCLARIPFAFWLSAGIGATALYFSYPLGWACGLVVALVYYFRGNWRQHLEFDIVTGKRHLPLPEDQ